MWRWLLLAHALAFVAIPTGRFAAAQETGEKGANVAVEEMVWGFDGKGVRNTFTPLSVLLRNNGAAPVSGTLMLERVSGGTARRIDVPIEADFNVPPFDQRWVQLVPWISDGYDSWRLRWGPGPKQVTDVPTPRAAERGVVLLVDPDELSRRIGAIRRFSSDVFPPSVTATDCLDAVVLDSAPDLQGARLQSFLDWIHRGGRVFLIRDDLEQFPKFPGALDVLNKPESDFTVGLGRVRRLDIRAIDIDPSLLKSTLMESPPEEVKPAAQNTLQPQNPLVGMGDRTGWDRDRPILGDLQVASRFRRRWWLIYPLALLYLGSIFPVSYLVGTGSKRVRWFYGVFLASVGVSSLTFITLGRVGAGERSRLRSATLAKQFGDGLYDVTQWAALAPIEGDSFVVSHSASGRLYAAGEDQETVLGKAVAGSEARLELDIPPASARPIISRFRANGPKFGLRLVTAEFDNDRLQTCSLVANELPADLKSAYVAYRDRIYPLTISGSNLIAETLRPTPTGLFASGLDQFEQGLKIVASFDREDRSSDELFKRLDRRLVGNAFGLTHELRFVWTTLKPGLIRLMLYSDHDTNFAIEGDDFPDRRGCVLYVFDLPVIDR
jgi:hypothetical protein